MFFFFSGKRIGEDEKSCYFRYLCYVLGLNLRKDGSVTLEYLISLIQLCDVDFG